MAELTVPQVNFSSLGELPKIYKDAHRERTLADLGKGLANGTVDYKQAGATLASLGDISGGLSLMKMGEEEKAGREFSSTIGGMYGQPQRAPSVGPQTTNGNTAADRISSIESGGRYDALGPIIESGPMAGQRALGKYQVMASNVGPWTKAHLGRELTPEQFLADPQAQDAVFKGEFGRLAGKHGPEGAARAWFAGEGGMNNPNARDQLGTTVSAYADKFNRGGPVQVASLGNGMPTPDNQPAQPQGVQVAQAPTPSPKEPQASDFSPRVIELIRAVSNPRLPASQKELAKTLLTRELDNSKTPDLVKQYLFAKGEGYQGNLADFKKSGAVSVNVGDGNSREFDKELDKKSADRFNKYIDNADAARKKMVDIDTMREISTRLGTQGAAAGVKEFIGPYADVLGINVEGLSDIQAYTQVIQRLAPQQRAPGSGSTSDIEFKGFIKSLPGLSQNPAAREVGLNTMEALTRDDIARGEIASRLSSKEITRVEAEKELRALPDPMKSFSEWRKANPQFYGQALKGATAAPSSAAPKGADAPPVEGARKAPDGKWYLQKDGKTYRVDQ